MNQKDAKHEFTDSYHDFLQENRIWLVFILFLAILVRLALMSYAPHYTAYGDTAHRYLPTALNLLQGNGFSLDSTPPFRPSEACVPLYPIFVAGFFLVFGQNGFAVVIGQILLDLITCVLIGFISFRLAPIRLKKLAALFSIIIYGVFSWYTSQWSVRLLTETMALFLTVLLISMVISGLQKRTVYHWFLAGIIGGFALLTRPDSVLLIGAVGLFLILLIVLRNHQQNTINLIIFSLAIGLTLFPWTLRNYLVFEKFQPLASEWGWARNEEHFMPMGYLLWIKTWITDETYFWDVFNQAFVPGVYRFEPEKLPDNMFDSVEERDQVQRLMAKYNETLYFTPEIESGFREIANQRIQRASIRFYVQLPFTRMASMWLTGFATHNVNRLWLRILTVLPIVIIGFIGLIVFGRQSEIGWLLILIVLIRTVYLMYHYAPETRYIVEAYPPLIAAGGVLYAWLFRRFFDTNLKA